MTSSVMTRRPRRLASTMKRRKSFMVPKSGLIGAVVGDVVAVVAAGRGIERQQPQRGDAEVLQIAELFGQAGEIADPVIVAVGKGLDVELIDDGVLVPQLVAVERPVTGSASVSMDGIRFMASLTPGSETAKPDRAAGRCAAGCRPTRPGGVLR